MAKVRVYELAKSLNKDSKEVLEILKKNGVEVKNHMSSVSDEDAGKVRARFSGKPQNAAPAAKSAVKPAETPVAAAKPAPAARPAENVRKPENNQPANENRSQGDRRDFNNNRQGDRNGRPQGERRDFNGNRQGDRNGRPQGDRRDFK